MDIDHKDSIFEGTVLKKAYSSTYEKEYVIPAGTTEIAEFAFFGCFGKSEDANDDDEGYFEFLESVVIPESVRVIGEHAFLGREKLKSVSITEGLEKIDAYAFSNCIAMESIFIPSTVTEISSSAFPVDEHDDLPVVFARIDVDPNNPVYRSINGILYSKDGEKLISVPANYEEEEFIVPEMVEIIGERAFRYNQKIKRVILPNGVTTICKNAFEGCYKLESINLENVKDLGESAFESCEKLKRVDLSVAEIPRVAFGYCSRLRQVNLKNTKEIWTRAFCGCGIKKLILPDGLKIIHDGAFVNNKFDSVTIPKSVVWPGKGSFRGCKRLTIYDTISPDGTTGMVTIGDNYLLHPQPPTIGKVVLEFDTYYSDFSYEHEIIVKSALTNEIKYKVWIGPYRYPYVLEAWGANASFDFRVFDDSFYGYEDNIQRYKIVMYRLRYPEQLSEEHRDMYMTFLEENIIDAAKVCIDTDDIESLKFCESLGLIDKSDIEKLIRYAKKKRKTAFQDCLLKYKEMLKDLRG